MSMKFVDGAPEEGSDLGDTITMLEPAAFVIQLCSAYQMKVENYPLPGVSCTLTVCFGYAQVSSGLVPQPEVRHVVNLRFGSPVEIRKSSEVVRAKVDSAVLLTAAKEKLEPIEWEGRK